MSSSRVKSLTDRSTSHGVVHVMRMIASLEAMPLDCAACRACSDIQDRLLLDGELRYLTCHHMSTTRLQFHHNRFLLGGLHHWRSSFIAMRPSMANSSSSGDAPRLRRDIATWTDWNEQQQLLHLPAPTMRSVLETMDRLWMESDCPRQRK